MATIVEFKNYSMGFKDDDGQVFNLLDRLNFKVEEGKALGVVGESGCGKSMTSLSLMRLLPDAATVQGGEIFLEGKDLLKASEAEMRDIRGNKLTMIFQEPMTALNPVLTIGQQIGEILQLHHPEMKPDEIRRLVLQSLVDVGIAAPETRIDQYPHEFSGGMRQRVMIAMAIINHPALLIADEPTTALDVTIQAQILDIMRRLKKASGSLMVITHNLGIVAEICEEVVVMYAGRAIERGTLKAIFDGPLHPYTRGLMASIPTMRSEKKPLHTIPGSVPTVYDFGPGCRFADRCEHCTEQCRLTVPPLKRVGKDHLVQCWLTFEGEVIEHA
jgi:oligopeptide/dipeptide ABC transporter ATP-binding protein